MEGNVKSFSCNFFFASILQLVALSLVPSELLAFKELALADTGVANPISALSPRYNPAGIVEVGDRWDVSVGLGYQNAQVKIEGSDVPAFNQSASATQAKWYPIGIMGITKQLTPSIAVGASTDATRCFKGSVSQGLNAYGTGRLGSDVLNTIVQGTIAWKANACHSFGFSLPMYIGRVRFKGFQNAALASPPVSVAPNNLTNRTYNYAVGLGLKFGWLWHVTPELNVGISYATKLMCSSSFHKFKGFLPNRGKLDNPPALRVGAAYKRGAATFIAEGHWGFYKEARSTGNSDKSTALLGSKKGPGAGWPTVCAVSLAVDYRFSDLLTLRGGWTHLFPTLVNKSNLPANFLGVSYLIKQAFTLGFTYEYLGYELTGSAYIPFSRKIYGKPSAALANGTMTVKSRIPVLQLYGEIGKRF